MRSAKFLTVLAILIGFVPTSFAAYQLKQPHANPVLSHAQTKQQQALRFKQQAQRQQPVVMPVKPGPTVNELKLQAQINALQTQVGALRTHTLAKSKIEQAQHKHHIAGDWAKKLIISGALNLQAIASNRSSESSFETGSSNKLSLGSAQLDAHGRLNPWFGAFIGLNDSPGQPNSNGGTGGLEVEQAYMYFGNYDKAPFMAHMGKQFLPFAVYKHHPVISSTTQILDETVKENLSLSTIYKEMFATIYAFSAQGSLNAPDDNTNRLLENGGFEMGTTHINRKFGWDVSMGYINNMAEAKDIYTIMPKTRERVHNFAGHVSFNVYNVGFVFDASVPSGRFNINDATFNGAGAKPQAYATEMRYHFPLMHRFPSTVAMGYQWTKDGLFVGLPKKRYVGSYTVYLNKHVNMVLEYMNNKDYDEGDTGTYLESGGSMASRTGTGRANSTGIVQVALHF